MVTNVLGVFALAVALMVAEGSWGKGKVNDMSNAEDLTNLYNSKVYEAERMTRPMEGQSHSGVRVTLEDGQEYLVHKGSSSQTVVVDADHMSDKWKVEETMNFGGSKTVSDFVKEG
ncbi:hypothetical protein Q7C36_007168 [Tachysurus vachellii]|uniref:Uncharacterized protein n=1 Tax=Tachysurus vachellii TaxID=175792 RepID=A0AA88NG61_TACVA|nr:hypothetical protein Q7C36_007168 [Tachysurus vachellii]